MIIGVSGFGFSGSGAVLDLLKDYPMVTVKDEMEFSFIYKPDGLGDLGNAICYYPVRYFSSDSAIRRFIQYMNRSKKRLSRITNGCFQGLLDEYLSNIIQIKWMGSTSVHSYQASSLDYFFRQYIPRIIRQKLENRYHILIKEGYWPEKEMYFSFLKEDEFLKYSRAFVSGIINSMVDSSSSVVVLDQCFAANDPKSSFKFFDTPIAINVIRDPRDNYLLAKNAYGYATSFIPRQKVVDFIKYYRGLMESRKYNNSDDAIIEVRFEDLIYDPERISVQLEKRLGLPHLDMNNRKHFSPEKSINNTQLWNKYPYFDRDVELIENELPEYLYPFEKYNIKPTFNNRTF